MRSPTEPEAHPVTQHERIFSSRQRGTPLLENCCGNEPSTPHRSKHSWRNAGGERSSLSPGHCVQAPSRAEMQPTGHHVSLKYSQFFVVRDDKVVSMRLYYDQLDLLTQLGLTPAPSTA